MTLQAKIFFENLEANFRNLTEPKLDFARKMNFDESKPLQTEALTKKLWADFESLN